MPKSPWERRDGESAQAFEAFQNYRDMGADRSLVNVARKLGKSATLMSRWSSKFEWVERAERWDAQMDEVRRKEHMEELSKMARRHAQQAEAGIAAIGQITTEFLRRVAAGDLASMSADDIRHLFAQTISKVETLTRVERQARGLPDLWLMIGQMSDDQLEAFVVSLLAEGQTTGLSVGDDGDEASGLASALADLQQNSE